MLASIFTWVFFESSLFMPRILGKEEESLRQELGKQEGEKGEARGSPSLGRLCPGSGNLSLASSGRLVLACALLQGLRFITPKAFSELLKLSREYQMLTVTKRLLVDAEPTSSVEQHNESHGAVTEAFANFVGGVGPKPGPLHVGLSRR
ncbi:hypothetical protein KSP40_PGU007643 [Platanthera guangdongensis]|uniref:Uncharacterized protein n=1 Tax=Platanthera guangdongensis TaxID=2320717 RepID=A0ABR2N1P7_9ASPA